ncbi:MAG: translation initiation factor IF-2 [Clostridiales bacterium]|nr:translation initiation factor IF-2 [Clostridiales bacterium]
MTNQKYRISDLAKDLDVKVKDITDILASSGGGAKNRLAALTPDEFNLVMNTITSNNQTTQFDKYISGEAVIKTEPKPAPAPKSPASTSQAPTSQAPTDQAKQNRSKPAETVPSKDVKTEAAPARQSAPAASSQGRPAQERPQSGSQSRPAAQDRGYRQQDSRPGDRRQGDQRNRQQQPQSSRVNISVQPPEPKSTSQVGHGSQRQNLITAEAEAKKAAQAAREERKRQQDQRTSQPGGAQSRAQKQGWINGPQRGKPAETAQQSQPDRRQGQKPAAGTQPDRQQKTAPAKAQPAANQQKPASPKPPATRQSDRTADRAARFENKPNFNAPQKPAKTVKKGERDRTKSGVIIPTPTAGTESSTVIVTSQTDSSSRIKGAKVVDTRTTNVDLSKYDERLEKLVPEAQKKESADKQKLRRQTRTDRESNRSASDRKRMKTHQPAKKPQLEIELPDEIVVNELAMRLHVTVAEVIKKLMTLGIMANVNQAVDFDTAGLVAIEFGAKVTKEVIVTIEDKLLDTAEDDPADLVERPPVVVVMGHVDHGKTSLLDAIRNTNVTAGEAGGITQNIGAYRVNVKGKDITFLDTPGHEAFTAMRARGAKATDIAVLVVAADDGIMPQTVEAINHAKAAEVDIIVAINKMDKRGANPQTIMESLTKYDLVPEEWGGDVMCVPVSALTGMNIDKLLENILLVAEVREYKANPNRKAKGVVIEARLDKGMGTVATVLVQNGTLNPGDVVIAGTSVGHIRVMRDEKGNNVKSAGPSVPVEIVGLDEVPVSGDEFAVVDDEKMARQLTEQRREESRQEAFKAAPRASLDTLFDEAQGGKKTLNIVIKGDVVGSVEAVRSSLEKLSNDEVELKVIHTAVGGISENDVMLASVSDAIIVGFNVRPDRHATELADRQSVEIRTYQIIYEMIDEVEKAMKGMLAPTFKEVVLGRAEVRQTIHVSSVGTIAGSYVQDGKITRTGHVRVLRDSVVIFDDKIASLRRFKDDVREVQQGYECGISLEKFNDIKLGDILECYEMRQVVDDAASKDSKR